MKSLEEDRLTKSLHVGEVLRGVPVSARCLVSLYAFQKGKEGVIRNKYYLVSHRARVFVCRDKVDTISII